MCSYFDITQPAGTPALFQGHAFLLDFPDCLGEVFFEHDLEVAGERTQISLRQLLQSPLGRFLFATIVVHQRATDRPPLPTSALSRLRQRRPLFARQSCQVPLARTHRNR